MDFTVGIAMILAPLVLAFPLPAGAVSAALGMVLTGIGLNLGERATGPAGSRGSVALHRAFDAAFAVVTAVAALALALALPGHVLPVAFLAAIVVIQAAQGLRTRYTAVR